jgi:two-component system, response regulator PdtaR
LTVHRILIVEDQLIIAADLVQILEAWPGYQALVARSADEALHTAQAQPLDLALLDIDLGRADDGITIAMTLKHTFSVRSIFISAFLDEVTRQRAGLADPVAYLKKLYAATDVRDVVHAAFGDSLSYNVSEVP